MLGLVGGAPGGHLRVFHNRILLSIFLSRTAHARAGKPEPKSVKGETSSYPSLDLLLDMHAGSLLGALGQRAGSSNSARSRQWQKGSQTLANGRRERSRAPSRPHARGPTRPRAARARRASVRPCPACCEASRTRTPSCASGSTTTRATSAGRRRGESTSTWTSAKRPRRIVD